MPLTGAQHTGTGSAVTLSSLSLQASFRQISIVANSGNSAVVYIGPTGMDTNGTNAWIALKPGQGWSFNAGDNPNNRERWTTTSIYVIATTSDLVHFAQVY